MNIPEPTEPLANKFHDLHNQQVINRFDNFREWHHLSDNAKELLEEVGRRFNELDKRYVPQLHTVFPDRREHPKVMVLFTEFRVGVVDFEEVYLMDVFCRVDREDRPSEYYCQTFDRDFKPMGEKMVPTTKDIIVTLMQDRITKI